ncbi:MULTISPECIES: MmpS family protein [Streptomyces]|uniref:MmpS family protein n=1 Tax=Streptomyces TaxID=1883 RepID=UPI001F0EB81C|nr:MULTISPECIES: MmpS family protein [Streptomyces]
MSYTQPPPPPGFGPQPSPPAPRPSWARKRVLIPAAAVVLLLGVGIGSAGNGGDAEKTAAAPRPTVTVTEKARADDEAEPAPTVTVTKTATAKAKPKPKPKADTADDAEAADTAAEGTAVFRVWGSAPSGVDITYGNDGTNLQGKGLPLKKTLTVKDDALYYQVTAQLMGGGDIQCSITIDGRTKTGRAQGGYNICSAQLNSDFSGGFS